MRTRLILTLVLVSAACFEAVAQTFRSGSNGSYGAINVPTSGQLTLDVPPDGIFHCTTITVQNGGTLRFRRNALNTPVSLLATGEVLIAGIVDVSGARGSASAPGLGGPGGFDGGAPGSVGLAAGDGLGPGGGKGGTAVDGAAEAGGASYGRATAQGPAATRGATYGSPLLLPLIGGSGGGGASGTTGWGGGGGGGALLVASDTQVSFSGSGTLRSHGGQALSFAVLNTGCGGAIRIVAPVVSGTGFIDVRGNAGSEGCGDGRIRVDALDRSGLGLLFYPQEVASVGGLMVVSLDPLPRLDVLAVAGRTVPLDTPTQVLLPTGSAAVQPIRIQARDFGQKIPIRVVLTPDSGASTTYDAEIDNGAANPGETTVNATFPVNVLTHIHVFNR